MQTLYGGSPEKLVPNHLTQDLSKTQDGRTEPSLSQRVIDDTALRNAGSLRKVETLSERMILSKGCAKSPSSTPWHTLSFFSPPLKARLLRAATANRLE